MNKPYARIPIAPGVYRLVYSEDEYNRYMHERRARYEVHPLIPITILTLVLAGVTLAIVFSP